MPIYAIVAYVLLGLVAAVIVWSFGYWQGKVTGRDLLYRNLRDLALEHGMLFLSPIHSRPGEGFESYDLAISYEVEEEPEGFDGEAFYSAKKNQHLKVVKKDDEHNKP